jgi:hypothetical protein
MGRVGFDTDSFLYVHIVYKVWWCFVGDVPTWSFGMCYFELFIYCVAEFVMVYSSCKLSVTRILFLEMDMSPVLLLV